MAKTPFFWLGSRRSRKYPVSPKAALLDVASSRGLPVPKGGVLLHELLELLLAESVLKLSGTRVTAADPHWLFETIYDGVRFPRMDTAVAVRAAFALPGNAGDEQPVPQPAGPALLRVDFADPAQLSESLCDIWSRGNAATRRDVLVMEMVEPQERGTAVSLPDQPADRILTRQTTLEPAKLARWQQPEPNLPPYAQRLQRLLRGVRRTFGAQAAWQIEWVDDGEICWLLQVQQS